MQRQLLTQLSVITGQNSVPNPTPLIINHHKLGLDTIGIDSIYYKNQAVRA